jgi:hypothetical protein
MLVVELVVVRAVGNYGFIYLVSGCFSSRLVAEIQRRTVVISHQTSTFAVP